MKRAFCLVVAAAAVAIAAGCESWFTVESPVSGKRVTSTGLKLEQLEADRQAAADLAKEQAAAKAKLSAEERAAQEARDKATAAAKKRKRLLDNELAKLDAETRQKVAELTARVDAESDDDEISLRTALASIDAKQAEISAGWNQFTADLAARAKITEGRIQAAQASIAEQKAWTSTITGAVFGENGSGGLLPLLIGGLGLTGAAGASVLAVAKHFTAKAQEARADDAEELATTKDKAARSIVNLVDRARQVPEVASAMKALKPELQLLLTPEARAIVADERLT